MDARRNGKGVGVTGARYEGAVDLRSGRRIGFAEFGPAHGHPIIWFHGTPGARRQIPPSAHAAVEDLDLRIISIERPGIGLSTSHQYDAIVDIVDDVEEVIDALGLDEFGVVGLSGGGPYALALGAKLRHRVYGVAVLGGVVPTVGPEACEAGPVLGLARRFQPLMPGVVAVGGVGLWAMLKVTGPAQNVLYKAFSRVMPAGDQEVFASEGMKEMFIGDLQNGGRRQFRAALHDATLFGRDWGFLIADVKVPVRWWHGDADPIVPLAAAEVASGYLRDVEFYVRPGESHLGGFAAAHEILDTLAALRPDHGSNGSPNGRSIPVRTLTE
jgi:pimeloyl-ACP methyl ester carboxylesterase